MSSPWPFIDAPTWSAMCSLFDDWVERDYFVPRGWPLQEPEPLDSVEAVLEFLFACHARAPLLVGGTSIQGPIPLDASLRTVCDWEVPLHLIFEPPIPAVSVYKLLKQGLCSTALTRLTFSLSAQGIAISQPTLRKLMDASPRRRARAQEELAQRLIARVGDRTLLSFFQGRPKPSGFHAWDSDYFGFADAPLKPQQFKTDQGLITVEVGRHALDYPESLKLYEWQATLRANPDSEYPDAVALGMIYGVAPRYARESISAHELRWASDEVASSDVSMMLAFLDQCPDYSVLLAEGDLCFLSTWERKSSTTPGTGTVLLKTALRSLKTRFRNLRTLVANVTPVPYYSTTGPQTPAAIQERRLAAMDAVAQHFQQVEPQSIFKGWLRLISVPQLGEVEVLRELGARDRQEQAWAPRD